MKRWIVYTPEYTRYYSGELEPPEYGADVVEIEAETKRDALALAVKVMLDDWHYRYCRDQQGDGESPYTGIKVDGPFTEADIAEPANMEES